MENKIICPNCSSEINVEKALSSRFKDHYEQEFKKQLADQQKQISEKANELYSEKVKTVKDEMNEKYLAQIQVLQEDNQKKKSENQKLKEKEIKLLKKEQGSMQMQGEVQELAIEEWLRDHFPLDTIDEVKKKKLEEPIAFKS